MNQSAQLLAPMNIDVAVLEDPAIKKIYDYLSLEEKQIVNQLMISCTQVLPNDPFSVKCFVEGTKQNSIYSRDRHTPIPIWILVLNQMLLGRS